MAPPAPQTALRTELEIAGLAALAPAIELARAFHHAVLDDHTALHATLAWLRERTSREDHAYFVDIAQFMAGLSLDQASGARWLDGEQHTRSRWRALVIARQAHLQARALICRVPLNRRNQRPKRDVSPLLRPHEDPVRPSPGYESTR